jgi:cardiolipin synthase
MARFVSGNRITLLESGGEFFSALEAAIETAAREVHLETYIFADDATGRRIAAALIRAAQRGVAVRVLVDGFGSRRYIGGLAEDLRQGGVHLLFYRPEVGGLGLRRQRLRRLHRKIALVDLAVGFVGGINIIDDLDTPGQMPPRFDYAVAVEGPLVARIARTVRHVWKLVAWSQLQRHLVPQDEALRRVPRAGGMRAALLIRDNVRHRREIENAYLAAIASARTEIVIANAYFLPGVHFRRALTQAANRGVRVVLLLQGRVEYALLHHASRALYGRLLEAGVEIWEYHGGFLHAKVAVADGHWATVGSSNIDPFSLLLAREANVVVEDAAFAATLRTSLGAAMESRSRQVSADGWRRQPWASRFMAWASYGLARLFMGMAGYGRKYDET